MNQNKITIVTVCFNSALCIEKAIQSVLQQSYKNIEYIIIDGGSTDGTVEIIKKYSSYITYWISEPDNGIYHAMNKGIKAATGDLIGFLSSNDWYADGAIQAIADKFEESHADVIYGDATIIDGEKVVYQDGSAAKLEDSYYYMPILHPAFFVRTSIQKKYGFDETYRITADYKFYMQIYRDGYRFAYTKHNIIHYYLGGASSELEQAFIEKRRASYEVLGEQIGNYKEGIEREFFENLLNHLEIFVKNGFAREWIRENTDKEEDIYMFGTGNIGGQSYCCLKSADMNVVCFIDNVKGGQGSEYKGLPVLKPQDLLHYKQGVVFISSYDYADEMESQLRQLGVQNQLRVMRADEFFADMVNGYIETVNESGCLMQH
ncbi:MAG TPA: hypothetical protein DDY31_10100 [Lachnospiraceae bacterium]|nr:hypothetical protein [Lachnospiraceae bacterium]